MEDNVREAHESFGLVGISRINCSGKGANLFGSSIKHGQLVALRIKRAVRDRNLHQYWYHSKEELIEVYMSPNQFAELITSFNVGDGVPCTLRYVNGKQMADCPSVEQREIFEDEFKDDVKKVMAKTAKLVSEIETLFASKATINKGDREAILGSLRMIMQDVASNMPFVQTQFNEAMDKTVTEAKAEVESFVNAKITSLGIDALNSEVAKAIAAPVQSAPLQLKQGESPKA